MKHTGNAECAIFLSEGLSTCHTISIYTTTQHGVLTLLFHIIFCNYMYLQEISNVSFKSHAPFFHTVLQVFNKTTVSENYM